MTHFGVLYQCLWIKLLVALEKKISDFPSIVLSCLSRDVQICRVLILLKTRRRNRVRVAKLSFFFFGVAEHVDICYLSAAS